jgi:ATP phosphoribosyltransferase regulatory subunit
MSVSDRWQLPEGIDEVLSAQARHIESLRRKLLDLFDAWGYDLVITPMVDFLDSLLTGTGHDLDTLTFKLIDPLSGELLGLRADITPQAARIDARQSRPGLPARLCYLGTVLRTEPYGLGGTRSPLQVGAELYGHEGVESDIEVLCLMLEMLQAAGVNDIHLDLGHVGVVRGLLESGGLTKEQTEEISESLQRKDTAELQEGIQRNAIPPPLAAALLQLIDLNGDLSVLTEAEAALGPFSPRIAQALTELKQIATAIHQRLSQIPLHIDLAELRGYAYHTGVMFAAYVPAHGQAIARGGRYDGIGKVFGHPRPATGFSADLRTLVALYSQVYEIKGIFAPWSDDLQLLQTIEQLRSQGERVIVGLPGQTGFAQDLGCDRVLIRQGEKNKEKWVCVDVS